MTRGREWQDKKKGMKKNKKKKNKNKKKKEEERDENRYILAYIAKKINKK